MANETDDLYSDGGEVAVEETETETEVSDTEKSSESGGAPALLPKGFFAGKDLKPGTICKVKVDKLTDGSVLVSYVPHKEEADEEMTVESSEVEELMA